MGGIIYIVAGSFIDGSGCRARRNICLTVQDGIITAIDEGAHLPGNDGGSVTDLSHCTILPALVDCSVSLSQSPAIAYDCGRTAAKNNEMLKRHICDCLAHGVLGVAENDDIDLPIEYQHGSADKILPDIRISSRDFIKIGYSGNIEDEDNLSARLNQNELVRLLRNRGSKKALVVANGSKAVAAALRTGCDAIEQGYGMGRDNLSKMAEMGVLWIPSAIRAMNALNGAGSGGDVCCRFSLRYVAPGKPVPGAEAFWRKTLDEQLRQLQIARELGVKTAVGTGAGSIGILHGESVSEEMKLFVKAGYSREEAIRSATKNGADFFGMHQMGSLAVGRLATFLVSRGTVQQLPRKLSYLEGIYLDGVPFIA
jgi:imidazolonepropionase-like amidohydrolase